MIDLPLTKGKRVTVNYRGRIHGGFTMDALRRVLQNSGQLTAQPSPYQAIRQAASETGTDFDYLWRTAKRESGLDPSARAST